MIESLELRIARSKIRRYEDDADENIVHASRQAQDCLDCEEFLDKGIAAFHWLEQCERTINEGACEGVLDLTESVEGALETLYESWLRPCSFADKWIARCQENGFDLGNSARFRDCCDRAHDWLERNASYKLSRDARHERFAQEPW